MVAQGDREVARMEKEKEVLKGEAFIEEALPLFREIEEEKRARESRTRAVCDYRGVNVARPPELERGVAESIRALGPLSNAGSLDLTSAWLQLPHSSSSAVWIC